MNLRRHNCYPVSYNPREERGPGTSAVEYSDHSTGPDPDPITAAARLILTLTPPLHHPTDLDSLSEEDAPVPGDGPDAAVAHADLLQVDVGRRLHLTPVRA